MLCRLPQPKRRHERRAWPQSGKDADTLNDGSCGKPKAINLPSGDAKHTDHKIVNRDELGMVCILCTWITLLLVVL